MLNDKKINTIAEEIKTLVDLNAGESRNCDFKKENSFIFYKIKIIKAALAFSNTKNGGYFVIGVSEDSSKNLSVTGLSSEDLASFNKDSIQEHINNFVSPPIEIELAKLTIKDKNIIVIAFKEFTSSPVLAKSDLNEFGNNNTKEGKIIIKKGMLYHRGIKKIESTEICGHEELSVFLDFVLSKKRNYCLDALSLPREINVQATGDDFYKTKEVTFEYPGDRNNKK